MLPEAVIPKENDVEPFLLIQEMKREDNRVFLCVLIFRRSFYSPKSLISLSKLGYIIYNFR